MRTFYHFGDSWTFCDENETIFSKYLSDYLSCDKFLHLGQKGFSNEQIFQRILDTLPLFEKNDVILINWSYLARVSGFHYDKNYDIYKTKSINMGGHSEINNESFPNKKDDGYDFVNNDIEYWLWLANGSLKFYKQQAFVLFQKVNSLMDYLIDKYELKIYHTFHDDYLDTKIIETPKSNVLFYDENENKKHNGHSDKNGYLTSIYNLGYHDSKRNDGSHYINGIQEHLCEIYIQEINRIPNNNPSNKIL